MWKVLESVPPSKLLDARLEAHHAIQWIARATRAYCKTESDDSHTSLSWDSDAQALMGRPLTPNLTLGLRLEDLTLLAKSKQGNKSFNLFGQTESTVGNWMTKLLLEHDLAPHKLHESGPYTLSHQNLDSGGVYGAADKKGIKELAKYYNNATQLLEAIRVTYPQASPVRCWPHFFDIATLLTFDQKNTTEKATIGVGCSPGDATYSEPYFYISLWPYPPQKSLPSVISPSFWHLEGFTALILRSSDLVSQVKEDQQQLQVTAIIKRGMKESVELLTQ